jgi:hypothetical protein
MITQTTSANIEKLLLSAKSGDTLQLVGNFPRITIYNLNPDNEVILDCTQAVITSLAFNNSSNFTLEGGKFLNAQYAACQVAKSSNLKFLNGKYVNSGTCGISITQCKNILVQGSDINSPTGDGVDISASQFITVTKNKFYGMISSDALHSDMVQFWNIANEDQTTDLTITENIGMGECQGFGAYTPYGPTDPGYARINISNNVIAIATSHAGNITNGVDCIMEGNVAYTLFGETHGWVPPSWTLNGITPASNVNGAKP